MFILNHSDTARKEMYFEQHFIVSTGLDCKLKSTILTRISERNILNWIQQATGTFVWNKQINNEKQIDYNQDVEQWYNQINHILDTCEVSNVNKYKRAIIYHSGKTTNVLRTRNCYGNYDLESKTIKVHSNQSWYNYWTTTLNVLRLHLTIGIRQTI